MIYKRFFLILTFLAFLAILTLAFAACPTPNTPVSKTVEVGAQSGPVEAGAETTVSFPVTTTGVSNRSYTVAVANLPAGVTVLGNVAMSGGKGTLTLSVSAGAAAGTYSSLTLTINGETSAPFTLSITPPGVKTVSVSAQTGILTVGTAGSATFSVPTENIATGLAGSVAWFSDAAGTVSTGAPAWASPAVTTGSATRTLTVNATAAAVAGTYYFRVTIDGTTSGVGVLTVTPAGAKTVSAGPQSGTITAGTAGSATFTVSTANIATGLAGSVSWFSDAAGTVAMTAPAWVTPAVTTGSATRTLTVNATAAAVAGTYYFRVTIDGTTSGVGVLTVVPALTYSISASPGSPSFGSLQTPYTQPAAQTVTVTNTGTGAVTLSALPAVPNYTLTALSATSLGPGATATFTIRPNAGLAAGTYNALFNVTGSNSVSATVNPTFAVTADPPGSATNPFKVGTLADLQKVGSGTDGWTRSAHYEQTAAIDIGGIPNWTPIGTSGSSFTGTYNGGGFVISNLTITSGSDSGLFGYVNAAGAVIRNVRLGNVNISGTGTNRGGLIGRLEAGTVENCRVTGGSISGSNIIGGLVGRTDAAGIIQNSYVSGVNVSATGANAFAGGIAGQNSGALRNCYTDASVTSAGTAGGIAGTNSTGAMLERTYAIGTVSSTGTSAPTRAGGITGFNDTGATVQNSVAMNKGVSVNSGSNIGRVAGADSGTLANNHARSAGMTLTQSGGAVYSPSPGLALKDGASVAAGSTHGGSSNTWWNSTALFNTAPSTTAWLFEANRLPHLNGFSGDTQNPEADTPGTAANPFRVGTVADLEKVGSGTDGWTLSAHYEQTAAINLSSVADWTPIGTFYNPFTGVYNGAGYVISNLTINSSSENRGLFGNVNHADAVIRNVRLGAVNISATAGAYLGGVAGQLQAGTIENCRVSDGSISGNSTVGGVTGSIDSGGTVRNCYVSGVSITGAVNNVGGVAGVVHGTVQNCYTTADVTGYGNVGGVAGSVSGTVIYCYATGAVTANGTGAVVYAGGIAGTTNSGSTIERCVALNSSVSISVDQVSNIGRVVGYNGGTLTSNWARDNGMSLVYYGTNYYPTAGTATATGKDGLDREPEGTHGMFSGSWWGTGVGGQALWPSESWSFGNNRLPTLNGFSGDTQNPTVSVPPPPPFSGAGTSGSPYLIGSLTDLQKMQELVNFNANYGAYRSAHYRQTADINLSSVSDWSPIGISGYPFTGVYDGDGKVISNLTIAAITPDKGLFGVVDDAAAVIKNVRLGSVNISAPNNTGGVAGRLLAGTIELCRVSGGSIIGVNNVGGLAGTVGSGGTVKNSYASGLSVSGSDNVGGVAGSVSGGGTVQHCYAAASVKGQNNVGGVVGIINDAGTVVSYSYAAGAVSATNTTTSTFVGGVAGRVNSGTINRCVAVNPSITSDSTANTNLGRVVGNSTGGTLTNNYGRNTTLGGSMSITYGGGTSYSVTDSAGGKDGATVTTTNLYGALSSTWWNGTAGYPSVGTWSYATNRLPWLLGFDGDVQISTP